MHGLSSQSRILFKLKPTTALQNFIAIKSLGIAEHILSYSQALYFIHEWTSLNLNLNRLLFVYCLKHRISIIVSHSFHKLSQHLSLHNVKGIQIQYIEERCQYEVVGYQIKNFYTTQLVLHIEDILDTEMKFFHCSFSRTPEGNDFRIQQSNSPNSSFVVLMLFCAFHGQN